MPYSVEIREVATGVNVTRAYPYEWVSKSDPSGEPGRGSLFWWTDGNFGCDCNRSMEFWRGNGVSEDVVRQRTSGTQCTNASGAQEYLVRITLPDGTVVLDEFDDEAYPDKEGAGRALVVKALAGVPLSEPETKRLAAAVEAVKAAYGKVPFDVEDV